MDAASPTTIEELDTFAGPGGAAAREGISASIAAEADTAAGPVRTAMSAVSTPPPGEAPAPAIPQPAPLAAPGSAAPALTDATPPPVPPESLDATEFQAEADDALAAHDVDDATLAKADEGPLRAIGDDKTDLNEKVATAADTARGTEAAALGTAQSALEGTETDSVGGMEGERTASQTQVSAEQDTTRSGDETGEQTLAQQIADIYAAAERTVNEKLTGLQENAVTSFRDQQAARLEAFSAGVRSDLEAFKDRRYSGVSGLYYRGRDWLLSINSLPEVKDLYDRHRSRYIADIDALLATIKTGIETTITECRTALTDARTQIDTLVADSGKSSTPIAQGPLTGRARSSARWKPGSKAPANRPCPRWTGNASVRSRRWTRPWPPFRPRMRALSTRSPTRSRRSPSCWGNSWRCWRASRGWGFGAFLSAAASQAQEGVQNHLWDQLQEAFKEWLFAKLPALQLLRQSPPNWLEMLAVLATSLIGLFTENLPAMLPAIGAAAMIWLATSLAAKLIPGVGAIMAVIDAIKAAWALVQVAVLGRQSFPRIRHASGRAGQWRRVLCQGAGPRDRGGG